MEKRIKRILGAASVAGVAIITGVTYGLPAANAAVNTHTATTTVELTVQANEEEGGNTPSYVPAIEIKNINEGATYTDSVINPKVDYKNTSYIEYTLKHVGPEGTSTYTLDSYNTPLATGVHDWNLDLSAYGGYGTFTLIAKANGSDTVMDIVSFKFNAIHITDTTQSDSKGQPIISTDISKDVKKVCYKVYYIGSAKSGDGTLVMENICHNVTDSESAKGSLDYALPFADPEYADDIKAGNYIVEAYGYNAAGTLIGVDSGILSNFVVPNTGLDVPNTGSFVARLSLSRADYLLSGIVIFGFATFLAFWLINRSRRASAKHRR